ncbi:arylsulfatase (plasmid) [Fulvitalea axinellae]|uniref:Arylsulfatase n=1 Tax=Fulvitalea axinellae TaxID=1182444 RepID=A0AAU9CT32_9BACT|nr:arylsulfatase [Fulvitalea axinellae]
MIKKTYFLACASAATLFFGSCGSKRKAKVEPERPNIVFILADDMGYGDIQALNSSSRIPTPNLNALSEGGATFTDAHTNSSVCTPTRYGVLTGRYCWRGRLKRGVINGYGKPVIEEGRETVASYLKTQGYKTGIVGKWHLGLEFDRQPEAKEGSANYGKPGAINYDKPLKRTPNDWGFDESYIISASLDFPPYIYIKDRLATELPTDKQEKLTAPTYMRAGEKAPSFNPEETLDHLLGKAQTFIKESAKGEKPFFLYFPITAPHKPVMPHKRFRGTTGLGHYADFVSQVDWTIGELNRTLKEAGVEDNTLVVYTSDNGSFMYSYDTAEQPVDNVADSSKLWFHPGSHRANHVFRGTKADIWEGGHRVPFLVRWPDKIKNGVIVDSTVCLTDLFATVVDITGGKLADNAGEDSFSFYSLLEEKQLEEARPPVIHHSIGGMFAIRDGKWKLVLGSGSGGRQKPRGKNFEKPYALYDMEADISERKNLIDVYPEVAERLEKKCLEIKEIGSKKKTLEAGI